MFTEDIFGILYWYRFGLKSVEKMQEYLDRVRELKGLQDREFEYSERHHVVPRSMNFDRIPDRENTVRVTAREHYELHELLKDCFEGIYDSRMFFAYWRMGFHKGVRVTPEEYELLKLEFRARGLSEETRRKLSRARRGMKFSESHRKSLSKSLSGKNLGKKRTDEFRRRKSESMSGDKNHFFGMKHSEESRSKMSASLMGRDSWCKGLKFSDEYRAKISAGTDNHGEKNPFYGKRHSEESRANISAHTDNHGEKNPRYGKKLMNNSVINKCVPLSEVEEYKRNGWMLGYVKKSS